MATRQRVKTLINYEKQNSIIGIASVKNLKTSSRKARVLANLVRGKLLIDACTCLRFQTKFVSTSLFNLLKSAAANAAQRGFYIEDLVVDDIQIHKGALNKRAMPRAKGHSTYIRKQSMHIDVRLSTRDSK